MAQGMERRQVCHPNAPGQLFAFLKNARYGSPRVAALG